MRVHCGVRAAGGGIICSSMHAIAASPLRLPRGCGATSHHCIPCLFSSARTRPAIGLQNSRRGDFSRAKIRGKRALELGAGMGLAGMALALQGAGRPSLNRRFIYVAACQQAPRWPDMPMSCRCSAQPRCHTHPSAGHPALFLAHCADVTFTDIGDVLPLLRRNVEQNISPAALNREQSVWLGAARALTRRLLPTARPVLSACSIKCLLDMLISPLLFACPVCPPQCAMRAGPPARWAARWSPPWTGRTAAAMRVSSRRMTSSWQRTACTASWRVRITLGLLLALLLLMVVAWVVRSSAARRPAVRHAFATLPYPPLPVQCRTCCRPCWPWAGPALRPSSLMSSGRRRVCLPLPCCSCVLCCELHEIVQPSRPSLLLNLARSAPSVLASQSLLHSRSRRRCTTNSWRSLGGTSPSAR